MSLDANKKVVEQFLACFGRSDVAGALAMMTDDATWWIGGKPRLFPLAGLKTKAEMGELLGSLVPAMKAGLAITPKAMTAEGDRVAVEADSYGEFPDGRVYNNEYHFLIIVRDGKVQAVKEYLDTMHTAEILGG